MNEFKSGVLFERERITALLQNLIGDSEKAIYVDEFIELINENEQFRVGGLGYNSNTNRKGQKND